MNAVNKITWAVWARHARPLLLAWASLYTPEINSIDCSRSPSVAEAELDHASSHSSLCKIQDCLIVLIDPRFCCWVLAPGPGIKAAGPRLEASVQHALASAGRPPHPRHGGRGPGARHQGGQDQGVSSSVRNLITNGPTFTLGVRSVSGIMEGDLPHSDRRGVSAHLLSDYQYPKLHVYVLEIKKI